MEGTPVLTMSFGPTELLDQLSSRQQYCHGNNQHVETSPQTIIIAPFPSEGLQCYHVLRCQLKQYLEKRSPKRSLCPRREREKKEDKTSVQTTFDFLLEILGIIFFLSQNTVECNLKGISVIFPITYFLFFHLLMKQGTILVNLR